MTVFLLWHAHDLDNETDVKLLGVYSSEERAVESRERAKALPGFRDHPDGFHIDKYEIDKDHWAEGYVTVNSGDD